MAEFKTYHPEHSGFRILERAISRSAPDWRSGPIAAYSAAKALHVSEPAYTKSGRLLPQPSWRVGGADIFAPNELASAPSALLSADKRMLKDCHPSIGTCTKPAIRAMPCMPQHDPSCRHWPRCYAAARSAPADATRSKGSRILTIVPTSSDADGMIVPPS